MGWIMTILLGIGGSLAATYGGQALGIYKAVSKSIARLEAKFGVRLFHRSTRSRNVRHCRVCWGPNVAVSTSVGGPGRGNSTEASELVIVSEPRSRG